MIRDEEFFDFLESKREEVLMLDEGSLQHIIRRSCEIKSEVVSEDERESGLRAILNYGHTIGHAVETMTGYKRYLHGEAVAIGIVAEARLSRMLGMIGDTEMEKIKKLIESYDLPSAMPRETDFNALFASMQLDKKAVSGELKFILPEKIGTVKIQSGVSSEEIKRALNDG